MTSRISGEFQPIEGVPGVTDETISYGVVGTGLSNPLGYCLLECYVDGIEAYFEYRNELGGVHGRELASAMSSTTNWPTTRSRRSN